MAAVMTHVLSIAFSRLYKRDKVACKEANRRVSNPAQLLSSSQKAVTTGTGIFCEALSGRHLMDAMPEEIAQIADPLFETGRLCIRISVHLEKERMPAAYTDVFV